MECNCSPPDLTTLIAVEHNLLIIMALVALLVISYQKVPKNHTSGHGDDGNASSIPGVQLAAAFSKTQAALVSSDSDTVKSGDPIAGKNYYSTYSKPRTLSELIDQINYTVEETLKKHILSSPLNIPFPDDCVVKVAGTTEWIDATMCERYFNFKFR